MKNLKKLSNLTAIYPGSYNNYKQTGPNLDKTCRLFNNYLRKNHIKRIIFMDTGSLYYFSYIKILQRFDSRNQILKPESYYKSWKQSDREIICDIIDPIFRKPTLKDPCYQFYDPEGFVDFMDVYNNLKPSVNVALERYEELYAKDEQFKLSADQLREEFALKNKNVIKLDYPVIFKNHPEEELFKTLKEGAANFLKMETIARSLWGQIDVDILIYPGRPNKTVDLFCTNVQDLEKRTIKLPPKPVSIEHNISFVNEHELEFHDAHQNIKTNNKATKTAPTQFFQSVNHKQHSQNDLCQLMQQFLINQQEQKQKIDFIFQKIINDSYNFRQENNLERKLLKV